MNTFTVAITFTLNFDDIAPKAHVKYHDFPAIGAVLGFLMGMVGTMVIP
jgi:zinc transporter, ZIP family